MIRKKIEELEEACFWGEAEKVKKILLEVEKILLENDLIEDLLFIKRKVIYLSSLNGHKDMVKKLIKEGIAEPLYNKCAEGKHD